MNYKARRYRNINQPSDNKGALYCAGVFAAATTVIVGIPASLTLYLLPAQENSITEKYSTDLAGSFKSKLTLNDGIICHITP